MTTILPAVSRAATGTCPPIPLPAGFRVELDPDTTRPDARTLVGGSPRRVLRLSAPGAGALTELLAGPVRTRSAGLLGRRLLDAGLAHPRPAALTKRPDVTLIIPVRDRPEMLARCLDALAPSHPVLVVDDGSADPAAIAAVCAAHGATLIRRPVSGGPGPARNTGLAQVQSEFVAFLDSDCVPGPLWIEQLTAHLGDPLVAIAAPRIACVPAPGAAPSSAGRYVRAFGSLDLGAREARVAPLTRVPYVPTAALVARRAALRSILDARAGAGPFDPALRYGEDVDVCWRLHAAGWRIRYDPAVQVTHHEPDNWRALLGRRFRYGTSAGPLAHRHPAEMPPLLLSPWPTAAVAGLLAGRPALAAVAAVGAIVSARGTLRRAGLPPEPAALRAGSTVRQTWLGLGRYGTRFAAPALVAALLVPGRGRAHRRLAAASLLLGPPAAEWLARSPDLGAVRFAAARLADDIAYGAGVWTGAVRARTLVPLRPVVVRYPRNRAHGST
jgi:mycofactocin system glycosyltransferase